MRGTSIRITSTPQGEAPREVRMAWIGLELPLANPDMIEASTLGVLSARRWWTRLRSRLGLLPANTMQGYLVERFRAISFLQRHAPEAAAWWIANLPEVAQDDGTLFLFDRDCCELCTANDNSPVL